MQFTLLDCYTSIINACTGFESEDMVVTFNEIPTILEFSVKTSDSLFLPNDEKIGKIVALFGDIAKVFKDAVTHYLKHEAITKLVEQALKSTVNDAVQMANYA